MPDPNSEHDSDFLERLRSVLQETTEFEDPPPESVARAKSLFRQQKSQGTHRLVWIMVAAVTIIGILGMVILFFPG